MEVLLVDDFPAILQSLKDGIDWEKLGIEKVHTATSAKVAKLILTNFPVSIIICDIEMPEESGLELAAWIREHEIDTEIVFLTSHAEFDYVKEAMHLGSFDYILQPVKFREVEEVIKKLQGKIEKKKHYQELELLSRKSEDQHNYILERLLQEDAKGDQVECERIAGDYLELFQYLFEDPVIYHALIEIIQWEKLIRKKKPEEVVNIIRNTCSGLLGESGCRITVTSCGQDCYWMMVFAERNLISKAGWKQLLDDMYKFVSDNLDFSVAEYYADDHTEKKLLETYHKLKDLRSSNENQQSGRFSFSVREMGEARRHPAISDALKYIERNMNVNLSRTEVAGAVNMSEEYFSRLFRQETGSTFKEYVLERKMRVAKELLERTDFSISVVASKIGYSNFSHFSQTFKTYSGMTPQEFRRSVRS